MPSSPPSAPLISVIAVSFNHERFVFETLQSIASQTYRNFELIYCDDASSDNTVAVAKDWLTTADIPVQTLLHTENRGLCRTLNEARQLCRGEFVQYVSCDDTLLPHKFACQLQAFANGPPSLAMVFSEANLIDERSRPLAPFRFSQRFAAPETSSRAALFQQLVRGKPCIPAPSALMRKAALDDIGCYDETLPTEDYDTWLRLLRKYDFAYLSEPMVNYRIHQQNYHIDLDRSGKWRQIRYHILRKHLDDPFVRQIFRQDLAQAVCDNLLGPVPLQDLIDCEFDLQEVADKVAAMKNSKTYWASTRLSEIYRQLRNLLGLRR